MFKLALKNIMRNKKRTFFSGLTIFIATVAVLAFLALEHGMLSTMRENAINQGSGNINIKSKLYEEHKRVMPLQFYIPNVEQTIQTLEKVDGVKSVSRKANIPVSIWIDDTNENAMVNAVDFNNSNYFDSNQTEYFEGTLPKKGSKDVVITTHLAKLLDIDMGDKFTFLSKTATGGSNAMTVLVTGIIAFNNSDLNNNSFYISPTTLSSMLRMDDGTLELMVYTDGKIKGEAIETALKDDTLIIQEWTDVMAIGILLDFADVFYGYIKVIFFVLASTVIINSTMMSVIERRREAATLIAIGYSERWVRNLFLLESAIISVLSAMLGAILGAIIINSFGTTGIDFLALGGAAVSGYGFNSYLYLSLPLSQYISTVIYAVIIAIIACIFPTRKILKLQPAVALHDEI
jgi:putative ABC transport system permease protein